ncbi:MAG: hemolysin III family protein [Croceitalea sp.]|nr:hemolysin III family protein [Croceitalea sp.]
MKALPIELRVEKWNAYSHGLGIILGGIGSYILIDQVKTDQSSIAIYIYCISTVLLFSASTLYHAINNPKIKRKLRVLDHISIYYLIAGTYTPICVSLLAPSKGWLLLYLVWGLALLGTILKIFFTGRFEVFSLLLYGLMGWMVVIDLPYLLDHSTIESLFLLALGGAFYTLGIIFYAVRRIPYNHLIWHFFVLGGAISHWCMIYHELVLKPLS